jgi:inhibitor of cysteine peptidase
MKTKLIIMAIMVILLLAAGACSIVMGAKVPQDIEVIIPIDEFSNTVPVVKETEVAEGGTLTVTLGSNPTTGYSWEETAQVADPVILEITSIKMLTPEGKGIVGAAGSQSFTFRALEKGNTKIKLDYSRPWEGGEKDEWTCEVEVNVK